MAVSSPQVAASANGRALIGGCYSVDLAQDLSQYGGGHPCFAATDHRLGRRDLMAVRAALHAPARSLPISTLSSVVIDNMLLPLAHGRTATGHDTHACFVIMPRPSGERLPHRPLVPVAPWGERELLDCALRPIAKALDQLHRTGMTHRAIRPNNLFRAKVGHTLILGGAWAAPPAMAQPSVFETPYSAMCHPAGRGEGCIADDVYALGVLLVTLAAGFEPMASLDDDAIIRAKLERGSFAALTANLNLSSTISDLLRGMLAEDPEHRPLPSLLADPYVARSRRLATRPRPRAQRQLDLGGMAVSDARTLAYAMHRAPRIAITMLRSAVIDLWLRRILGEPNLAGKLDEIVRGGNDDQNGGRTRSDSFLLMRAIAVLDPLAPLCWQGLALFPDGLGPLLADVGADTADAAQATKIEAIIEHELSAIWGEARPARSDIAMLRLDCRQQRILLRTAGWAGGLSRVAYALNLLLPCRSPLIAHEAILRIHELIPAWDRRAGAHHGSLSAFVIDPESAAFIAARFNGRIDSDLAILAQNEDPDIDPPGHRGLAQLRVLGRLCEQDTAHRWPALAEAASLPARTALSQWKSRTARAEREHALAEAVGVGSIPAMLAVLVDASAQRNDALASQAASLERHRIDIEIARLSEARASRSAQARNTGHEVAAALGMITLAGAAVVTALL